ncbi:ADP-ribosylation factor GTPase-activating protein [Aspergillus clavatus NRRL 1]|uniref:ARF GTPase activator (Glo3), putative n=1 Tax=Aspergillus clavatus (strain ATCC 1007 / CBS 513.65 / DSM 816 / NCTC 3887 / NRRL 1 / QM 1276 / 107) TaxID=344612 RepID=A1C642_ASPCL|nr:ARF GTPase activator (Glo3), putative [Aspergillus clavatus NRRL 1]EAW13863.1 ARF GTPase activator (Glo3), putative [Aspergillus clavatus NRRL 1]
MSASKAQSQKIFEKLKLKPANKARIAPPSPCGYSYASTAALKTQHGRRCPSVSIYALTAPLITATSVSTFPLFAPPTLTLRVMKVGGNESATKYFQSHGGSAALSSKDVKVKYTCNAAVKYKEELKRRAAQDAQQYPEEVVITDVPAGVASNGSNTPAGDGEDDFFSSWDKPSIKRPSNPPSRTGTPPVVSRTASPFLNAGANGSRSKSPLSASDKEATSPAPTAIRSSASVRKTATTSTAKKGSVLGAKKAPKLGAKKIGGAEIIDFEEAERKAKEEAERIEKLGYDPEAEQAEAAAKATAGSAAATTIASPTPISPGSSSFGSTSKSHERSANEMERLGMGMGRLGFGQTVGAKPAPKKLGFGSVAPARTAEDDEELARTKSRFGAQKGISSDEFFGRERFDPTAQAEAKDRLRQFDGATAISSNAYFGRPEDDLPAGDDTYGDLETAAKDFVRRFGITAGDDLENLTQLVGEGAVKLQGAIRSYLNS